MCSLVSMLNRGMGNKTPPQLETYTTIQPYELPGFDQEVYLYKKQASNIFCGDGWTKLPFFGSCSLTSGTSPCDQSLRVNSSGDQLQGLVAGTSPLVCADLYTCFQTILRCISQEKHSRLLIQSMARVKRPGSSQFSSSFSHGYLLTSQNR